MFRLQVKSTTLHRSGMLKPRIPRRTTTSTLTCLFSWNLRISSLSTSSSLSDTTALTPWFTSTRAISRAWAMEWAAIKVLCSSPNSLLQVPVRLVFSSTVMATGLPPTMVLLMRRRRSMVVIKASMLPDVSAAVGAQVALTSLLSL